MRQRIDGIETRKRIIRAACQVFATKGFRDGTVAEICRRARANTAAINYHFRDKESLYVAVWQHAAEEARALYPMDGGVPAEASAEARFHGLLLALLRRMTDQGRLGDFHRLRTREMANPTGIIDQVRWQVLKPQREYVLALLRELLGPQATDRELEFCEMAVIGPCLMAHLCAGPRRPAGLPALTEREIEGLAEHLRVFALAGLQALRARVGRRRCRPSSH